MVSTAMAMFLHTPLLPLQFHAQQLERHQKAAREAKELQQFHHSQMAEHHDRKEEEKKEDWEFIENNMHMLQVYRGYRSEWVALQFCLVLYK